MVQTTTISATDLQISVLQLSSRLFWIFSRGKFKWEFTAISVALVFSFITYYHPTLIQFLNVIIIKFANFEVISSFWAILIFFFKIMYRVNEWLKTIICIFFKTYIAVLSWLVLLCSWFVLMVCTCVQLKSLYSTEQMNATTVISEFIYSP